MRENLPKAKAHHLLPSFENNPRPVGARALAVRCDDTRESQQAALRLINAIGCPTRSSINNQLDR